jgi:hypothetical protein
MAEQFWENIDNIPESLDTEKWLKKLNNSIENTENKSFLTEDILDDLENKILLQTNYSSGVLNLNILESYFLNFHIFQNYKTKFISDIWLWLNHNFESKFYFDKNLKKVEVILSNWKANIFEYKDFEYEWYLDNDLGIIESKNQIEIYDNEEKVNYIFDKNNFNLIQIISENKWFYENENKQINLFYNDDWKLDYVTDNNTNSYFFTYENDLLKELNDIFWNKIFFEYVDIDWIKILSKLKYKNIDSDFEYIYFWINKKNKFEIIWENTEIKLKNNWQDVENDWKNIGNNWENIENVRKNNLFYEFIDDNISLNNDSEIKYFRWLDWNLYSFLWNNIYLIKNGKRKILVKNDKQIESIFVDKNGVLYFYDWSFKSLTVNNKIKIILDNIILNNFNFIFENDKIYYFDKFNKWYLYYDLKSKAINKIKTQDYYNLFYFENWEISMSNYFHEHINYIWKDLEFEEKFGEKLDLLKNKINNNFTQNQKQKLKKSIQKYQKQIQDKIKNKYSKIELEYLLDSIYYIL